MNINFELYKVFYCVANAKSISKGAEELMISQPAVTQSIKTLEDELNGKLFIRTQKGVTLTHEGEILYNYVKEGMNYFINGKNKFDALKELDEGIINIKNELTENLIKELRNGNLDILIMSYNNEIYKDLEINEITKLHDIFVSTKQLKMNFNDILNEGILIQKNPSITRTNFNKFIKDNNLEYKIKMEAVSHSLLTKLTENNFGISLLTKEFIKDKLNNTLYEVITNKEIPSRSLVYAIKQDTYPSFTTSKFIDLLNKKTD